MAGQTRSTHGDAVLLFGPQALSFDEAAFQNLRAIVSKSTDYGWILDTVAELPTCFESLARECPAILSGSRSGLAALEDLQTWFRTGKSPNLASLPNIVLSPLVVITQLVQYAEFHAHRQSFDFRDLEVLGLCTGVLAGLAVSCATDKESLERFGATAIRLGMLIGLVVDGRDAIEGPSKSLATMWHSAEKEKEMMAVLEGFNSVGENRSIRQRLGLTLQTYISVFYDENRATVTTAADGAANLQSQLRARGVTATDIGLRGRFHWHGHSDVANALIKFCASDERFRFPDADRLTLPTRASAVDYITQGPLTTFAIRSILLEPARWYESFCETSTAQLAGKSTSVISIGLERCVPPSLVRVIGQRLVHLTDSRIALHSELPENDIAVIGMSCKVAGADDINDFWELLCEGKSQHQEVPKERFGFETVHREFEPQKTWYGNFINDHDTFDHKFFKKTPREATSMDPQQRQILQVAYQAVQQSGYFRQKDPDQRVGCYLGVCSTDYEDNIACHPPTAYSATGHLRGFIAGKISHFFGWTGPGLTIDTACSSSAVAVHQACRAILEGDCTAAIAGGSHVMSSPLWYQNLAGASFLSKTGACKPFDADADGYCRGEGVAAVFLKKLSTAMKDGDPIIGVIAGSKVQQNENCTPIVVPNVPSLSGLFENVLEKARLKPEQVTVVEAHGTGTPVGDPAEFESIRKVFGGPRRPSPVALGSVKGLVGHCECTSGIISLIKILLMIQKGSIPPQASFKKLNPAINVSAADQVHVATTLTPWAAEFRAALINNYGASGSNASVVVTQAPPTGLSKPGNTVAPKKLPFWFCGFDDRSLQSYVSAFRKYIERENAYKLFFPDLAFSLSRQSNRSLGRNLLFSCQSVDDLDRQLEAFEKGETSTSGSMEPPPLILCFGGQVSNYVGLDRRIYENIVVFRNHLNDCDSHSVALGIGSIFPDIFEKSPINDPVKLQTCLFALQYSCAKSWMESGVKPVAVIGHSFGELTSLCIAGVLTLEDAINMIVARARLIRDDWGPERGTMMAVEVDLVILQQVLLEANKLCGEHEPAVIACYNTPTSFTVAGSGEAIDLVAELLKKRSTSAKMKRLNVTHAFHSTLVDPLMDKLSAATKHLKLKTPEVYLGRCTEQVSAQQIMPQYFADHLRMPVFFNHSVYRLANQFPNCVWLEAGSSSTITNMACRALASAGGNHFQSINLTTDQACENLADATLNLWRAGVDVSFWAHHSDQTHVYRPLFLPPYQFEKARHWLELKSPPQMVTSKSLDEHIEDIPKTLTSFIGYQDKEKRCARFRVNTKNVQYEELMRGHVVAHTAPICPATVQVDLAIESLRTLLPPGSKLQPQVQDVRNEAPICVNESLSVWLDLENQGELWTFKFTSTGSKAISITHTRGEILLRAPDDLQTNTDFARYERLTGHSRCTDILNDADASDILQGRSIYKTFSEVVEYHEQYQGLQKVVGKGQASAARVTKKYDPKTWFDAYLSDTFCQIIGIWVNYMTDRSPENLYIAKGFEKWVRSPKVEDQARPDTYDVLAYHQGSLDDGFITDVFVFHPITGQLMEIVLGFQFVKVAKSSLVKLLSRLTHEEPTSIAPPPRKSEIDPEDISMKLKETLAPNSEAVKVKEKKPNPRADLLAQLKAIMSELSGVEVDQIFENTELADIGIDSLMGMELVSEIERTFKCKLPEDEISQVTDVVGVLRCVQAALNMDDSEESDSSESVFDSPISTPDSELRTSVDAPAKEDMDSSQPVHIPAAKELIIPLPAIFKAFHETKALTDQSILEAGCSDYVGTVLPRQNDLCIALTLEAFEQMGCSFKSAKEGEEVKMFDPLPEHTQLVRNLCQMLEKVAHLIIIDGQRIIRTSTAYPAMSSVAIKEAASQLKSNHHDIDNLIFYVGSRLADALRGKVDGVKLIFGCQEGRDLVSKMYGDWIMNLPCYRQMEDFLSRLVATLSPNDGPIKILEMGGGTGGTTKWLLPLLDRLNHPVEYTFTDLAPSFVAAARKRFKQYSFVDFRAHDIEKEPAPELLNRFHMVVASNAIHATHSLTKSTTNVKKALLPNGILMMLEMIEPLYWVDMIFGLFEGWWLFDDGRTHALTPVARWKTDLQTVGFGHVDWSDGERPEANINKLILGVLCDETANNDLYSKDRQRIIDQYVDRKTSGFTAPIATLDAKLISLPSVLVTGATGSTGSHVIANLAGRADIGTVYCLNRRSSQDPRVRQLESLTSKGIVLSKDEQAKLQVMESDTTKPHLGLPEDVYQDIVSNVTHIIHNAWPMSIKRPIKGFETQFSVMRNLIDLARDAACTRPSSTKIHFEFVSSIAVVGYYPLWKNENLVPEERMPLEALPPIGYADAKYVCEKMLDATLHQHPDRFGTLSVRIGQIAGSKSSGYWNPAEHLAFIWKSSQTLGRLPALRGPLSWTPVDDVAGTLVDLVFADRPHPVYNIDNPVRQSWEAMLPTIAEALHIPPEHIIPFPEWVDCVRSGQLREENPASKLVDFLDHDFRRMSCGGVLLDTAKAREHSPTLRAVGPVSPDVTRHYFAHWRRTGFLN